MGVKRLWWYFYLVWRPSPFVCCLLLPQTRGCYWLFQWSNPVSIGSHSDQTSFQSSSLYLWALGKCFFVKTCSSTLCCTVFLCNVFGLRAGGISWSCVMHTAYTLLVKKVRMTFMYCSKSEYLFSGSRALLKSINISQYYRTNFCPTDFCKMTLGAVGY